MIKEGDELRMFELVRVDRAIVVFEWGWIGFDEDQFRSVKESSHGHWAGQSLRTSRGLSRFKLKKVWGLVF